MIKKSLQEVVSGNVDRICNLAGVNVIKFLLTQSRIFFRMKKAYLSLDTCA